MSRVTFNQRGYVGQSMSVRAKWAYEEGEMPKSKWTKAAMLAAIQQELDYEGIELPESIRKMKKADIFDRFFEWKSWHHTGKFAQETDFYGVDEEAVYEAAGKEAK